jgi:hypothetical protein
MMGYQTPNIDRLAVHFTMKNESLNPMRHT